MSAYIAIALILGFSQLVYFRLADRYNIIDKPNERSSHNYITIRGGGIVFPVAALTWFIFSGFQEYWILFSGLMLATVSFLDDLISLSNRLRFGMQFFAVSILFWQLQLFGLPWFFVLIAYIITIGWINAFNFMDGINGISAFYAIAGLLTFLWLEQHIGFQTDLSSLMICLLISACIFAFFNARKKAKTFAGDVGSISMAFFMAWFLIRIMMETGRIEYILLVAVYGIDSSVTIFFRLMRKENIFKPHRSHLYQFLANELKIPHVAVSLGYGVFQVLINLVAIHSISSGLMTFPLFLAFLIGLILLYTITRLWVLKCSRLNPFSLKAY